MATAFDRKAETRQARNLKIITTHPARIHATQQLLQIKEESDMAVERTPSRSSQHCVLTKGFFFLHAYVLAFDFFFAHYA
jgi:hypothetical protein